MRLDITSIHDEESTSALCLGRAWFARVEISAGTALAKDKKWIVTADTGPDSMMVVWEREPRAEREV